MDGADEVVLVHDVVGAELGGPLLRLAAPPVPITVRAVRARASWSTIEPTPPAAPTASSVPVSPSPSPNRSKSVSHAVIVVSGSAAASAKSRLRGLCPDDALVDHLELRVRARPGDRTRVVDLVADREPGDLVADRGDDARGVVAEDLGHALRIAARADLQSTGLTDTARPRRRGRTGRASGRASISWERSGSVCRGRWLAWCACTPVIAGCHEDRAHRPSTISVFVPTTGPARRSWSISLEVGDVGDADLDECVRVAGDGVDREDLGDGRPRTMASTAVVPE